MKALSTLALACILGSPALAEPTVWIDNPGFCNESSGAEELADVAFLGPTGIESHSLQCLFQADQDLTKSGTAKVPAKCDDGGRTFSTTFDMDVNDQGRVTLFSNPPVALPYFYFSCDLWGYKGR